MPLTFAPPLNPEFPLGRPRRASVHKDPAAGGVVKSRTRWQRTLRRWRLRWKSADQELIDYIDGFFDRVRGSAEAFQWELFDPALYHPRPPIAPDLAAITGGALGARTYRVAYAWGNANGETQRSPIQSVVLGATQLMTATVDAFPAGATFAAIYATASAGPTEPLRQTVTVTGSGGTFTEDVGGLDAGAQANTDNQFKETVLVAFAEDELNPDETSAGPVYRVDFTLEERILA